MQKCVFLFGADFWRGVWIVYLLPFFFLRVTWGDGNAYFVLPFVACQIAVAILALSLLLAEPVSKRLLYWVLSLVLLLLCVHGLHALHLDPVWGEQSGLYLYKGLVLWSYLALCLIFAVVVPNGRGETIVAVFRGYSFITVIVCLISATWYIATGIPVLMNHYEGYGLYRAQAFMSEPSALAPVVSFLLLLGVWRRHAASLLFGLFGILATISPIVVLVTLLSQATVFFLRSVTRALLATGALFVVIGAIFTVPCDALDIASFGAYENLLARATCGVQAVVLGDGGEVFQNERMASTKAIFDHLTEHGLWWSGLGLNSTAIFMEQYYGEMRDNALWVSMAAFFGIWGILGYLVLAYLGFSFLRKSQRELGFLWISFFWAVSLNSAQGFYTYALFFVLLVLLARSGRSMNSNQDSRDC